MPELTRTPDVCLHHEAMNQRLQMILESQQRMEPKLDLINQRLSQGDTAMALSHKENEVLASSLGRLAVDVDGHLREHKQAERFVMGKLVSWIAMGLTAAAAFFLAMWNHYNKQ